MPALRGVCEREGATFLLAPAEVRDADGMLAPEASTPDDHSIHANDRHGAHVLRQLRKLQPAVNRFYVPVPKISRPPFPRSPREKRLVADVPHGHWKTLTLVAALRIDGLTAPYVVDGAMDGPSFLAYVEQVLAPTLRKADIAAADAALRYLPAYSPDLNPKEQAFSKLKKVPSWDFRSFPDSGSLQRGAIWRRACSDSCAFVSSSTIEVAYRLHILDPRTIPRTRVR